MSVKHPPSPQPSPPGEGEHSRAHSKFGRGGCSRRRLACRPNAQNNKDASHRRRAANVSPSPGGEGWGEGGRNLKFSFAWTTFSTIPTINIEEPFLCLLCFIVAISSAGFVSSVQS